MKLLMITRKIDKDDGLAGFTFNWVKKLSSNVDKIYVMCLEKGNADGLPENVTVYSLGKEKGKNRWREFWRFHKYAVKLVPKVDGVFAHQNPEYGILISLWTKIFRKRLVAWYAHGGVGYKLKLLNFLGNKMISSTPSGFKLPSKKLTILHQGIDTEMFDYQSKDSHDSLTLLSVSRLSEKKNIHFMLDLIKQLKDKSDKKIIFNIIGTTSNLNEEQYLDDLYNKVRELGLDDNVKFLGSIANDRTPPFYKEADIFLNYSDTASLDKTILEAMSCGTLVLTSNESAKVILSKINKSFCLDNFDQAFDKMMEINTLDKNIVSKTLSDLVKSDHSLDHLMKEIADCFR